MTKKVFTGCLLLVSFATVQAAVKVNGAISDHMVLQRNQPAAVFGWAEPGEKVTVSMNGASVEGTAAADGKFVVYLPAMPAGGPYNLTIQGKDNQISVADVMVGEVWLCSGQSNMWWTMERNTDGKKLLQNIADPNIRLLNIPQVSGAVSGQDTGAVWSVCDTESASGFSAVGYFFAKQMQENLDVPIGVINSSWSGTPIEPWISQQAYFADQSPMFTEARNLLDARIPGGERQGKLLTEYMDNYAQWQKIAKKAWQDKQPVPQPPAYPADLAAPVTLGNPSTIYNNMIAPLTPYTLAGFIWYQGEANLWNGAAYTPKMHLLADGWRKDFNNAKLPFLFVQVAPFKYQAQPTVLPALWEAQQAFADEDANAYMIVINDSHSVSDIHPPDKRMPAKRLGNLALKYVYELPNVPAADFPRLDKMDVVDGKVQLTFKNTEKLKSHNAEGFEMSDAAGRWFPAKFRIKDNVVTVSCDKVDEPTQVRYNYHQEAEANLADADSKLPLGAFKVGEIPVAGRAYKFAPQLRDYSLVYRFNPGETVLTNNNCTPLYAAQFPYNDKFDRIAYFMELIYNDNSAEYVCIEMDAFTDDIKKIGLPAADTGAVFQVPIKNVTVSSNAKNVAAGKFATGCNIEFFAGNYAPPNALNVPNASSETFDFGDSKGEAVPGYGSFQFHNYAAQQTIFAFNAWQNLQSSDLGIGSNPQGNPDWTFSKNAQNIAYAYVVVFVKDSKK